MKDAINYFIPIVKDSIDDITGRCAMNNVLDTAYCGTYQLTSQAKSTAADSFYPEVQMETNSMEIQYNNHINIEDDQRQQNETAYPSTRKRNKCDCESDSTAKRLRREDEDPSYSSHSQQLSLSTTTAKCQTHQRQPTHNMPDMPRCMMGHYI